MKILLTIILASLVSYIAQAQCSPSAKAMEFERNIKNHGDTGWDTFQSTYQFMNNNDPQIVSFDAQPGYYYEAILSTGYYFDGVLLVTDESDATIGKTKQYSSAGPSLSFQVPSSGTYYLSYNVISNDWESHCVIVSISQKEI